MTSTEAGQPARVKASRALHPWRWVATAVVVVAAAMLVSSIVTNPNWQWEVVAEWIFSPPILRGVLVTLLLTVASMAIGIVLGTILTIMRMSPAPAISGAAWFYVWLFRGTPIYVQLFLWGSVMALYAQISLGIPFGPEFVTFTTSQLIVPMVAALLGLGLNEAAYMSEIVRGGLLSIDKGQSEAASALGMRRMQTLRKITLPQAMRVIVPPTGNQVISMLKTTSLVIAIPVSTELFFQSQVIGNRLFEPLPLAVVASIWYLALTSVFMIGQRFVEKRFSRGFDGSVRGRAA